MKIKHSFCEKSSYNLSGKSIDTIAEILQNFMGEYKIESKEALRIRLSVEEVLLIWLKAFGEKSQCNIQLGSKLTKPYIIISVAGKRVNPFESSENIFEDNTEILANIGVVPHYTYQDGINQIILNPKRPKRNPITMLMVAVLAAVIAGIGLRFLPPEIRVALSANVLDPLINIFLGLLTTVALPMIFFTICWSVFSIGDISTFGKIGKKMTFRMVHLTILIAILSVLFLTPFFSITAFSDSAATSQIEKIIEMIENIFPKNIISPFADGSAMQIIIIAIAIGTAMLVLGKRANVVSDFVKQANDIADLIMEYIVSLIPIFVFINITKMLTSDSINSLIQLWKPITSFLVISLIISLIILVWVSITQKVNIFSLAKKLSPVFFTAFSTASSAATHGKNVSTCIDKLGINEKIVKFGVPFGTVIYMPSTAICLVVMALYMAGQYNVAITVPWLVTAVIISVVLSVAAQPIPGGSITCYSIMFLQLGIPQEAILLATIFDILADFPSTAFNQALLPIELTLLSDKFKMLDKTILHSK